jgi:hypothetical protein
MSKYLIIVGAIVLILLANYYTNEIGEAYYESEDKINKIFDVVHHYTPDFHEFGSLVNVIPLLLFGSFFFLPKSMSLIEEVMLKILLIHLIRSLTIISTILPKHEKCNREDSSFFSRLLGDCYDKVFSGHTSFVFLNTLILLREKYISLMTLFTINATESIIILLTRSHYTIDVILAYFITYLVYDGDYHILTDFAKKLKM